MSITYADLRADQAAKQAVGLLIRLNIAENTFITGKIEECVFAGWEYNNTLRKHAKFRVTVRAGANGGYEYTYTVLELPTPYSAKVPQIRVLEYYETDGGFLVE